MRKFVAGVVLCAFVSQLSIPASASKPDVIYASVNGVAASAAGQIATAFLQNLAFFKTTTTLAAIVSPPQQVNMPRQPVGSPPSGPTAAEMNAVATAARAGATPFRSAGMRPSAPGVPPPFAPLPLTPAQALAHGPAPQNGVRSLHAVQRRVQAVPTSAPNVTGIDSHWTYEEGPATGIGKYMVNIATGNLLLQADDVDIPERGIDLAVRRTYNSQSQWDYAMSDGSLTPAQSGAHWVTNFDAHVAPFGTDGSMSVFDIDGTRYDYGYNGTACLTPPPGQHATLCYDGVGAYNWTKKSGTVYDFWVTTQPANFAAYAGRLIAIYSRNWNNNLQLQYSWSGDASTSNHLTKIVVQHSNGHALTLNYSNNTPSGHTLLMNIQEPDQATYISYGYDNLDNLIAVTLPANSTPATIRQQQYGYFAGGHQLYWAAPPRETDPATHAGGYVAFNYDGSNRVQYAIHWGVMNPTPADGLTQALQPNGPHPEGSFYQDWWQTFTYYSGVTALSDTDGHWVNRTFDSQGRVVETIVGTSPSTSLTTWQSWDASNNITSTTDVRNQTTNYAYDAMGNTLAVSAPAANGYHPTTLLSYDAHNNVLTSCDPVSNHTAGRDWSGSGAPPSCPSGLGATVYSWDTSDSREPSGRLSDTSTPMGYHAHIAYGQNSQGGDYGLPTQVIGDTISQVNGVNRTPVQNFRYDGSGNLIAYDKGSGSTTLTYDTTANPNLNRLVQVTDPDGVSSYTYYYPNGQVSKTETALQHATNSGVALTYDPDGNETTELHHHGGTAATTNKFYDGDDRLIEVQQPHDATDVYTNPSTQNTWITRYLYDLTQPGRPNSPSSPTTPDGITPGPAYGNLYATQELLPSATSQQLTSLATGTIAATSFRTLKASAFDALDRAVKGIAYVHDVANTTTSTYDAPGAAGLLANQCNQLSQCVTMSYDALGEVTQVSTNDNNDPTRTYSYDANGRTLTATSATFGTQSYTYDSEGKITSSIEPAGLPAHATLTYHYYPDGKRSSLDVASSALNQGSLLSYAYENDGLPTTLGIRYDADSLVGSSAVSYAYKSSGSGRLTTRTESGPMANPTAKTFVYDSATGTLNSETLPSGSFSNLQYSPEGELTNYTSNYVQNGAATSYPVAEAYSSRGELLSVTGQFTKRPANGVMITTKVPTLTGRFAGGTPTSVNWDTRMGVMTSMSESNGASSQWTFDAAGRETTSSGGTQDDTPTFDAENHTIGLSHMGEDANGSTYTTNMGYLWGPNGHPAMVGTMAAPGAPTLGNLAGHADTLHWDGDQLLFTTNAQGQVDDIKIGNDGDITPQATGTFAGVTWWDRDPMGNASMCHNATGSQGVGYTNQYHLQSGTLPCTNGSATSSFRLPDVFTSKTAPVYKPVGSGSILTMVGRDGFTDGFTTFQGVRTYDPALGAWTTPDAYAGNVHDPSSQKSYMWNNANPVQYADPSGYFGHPWGEEPPIDAPHDTSCDIYCQSGYGPDPSSPGGNMPGGTMQVAQNVVPELIETLMEASESGAPAAEVVAQNVTRVEIEDAWSGQHSAEEAWETHGAALGLGRAAFAARPLVVLVEAMRSARFPAVVGAAGRIYIYDPVNKAMAIFGYKGGQLTIENFYRVTKEAFENQGSWIYPRQVSEFLGSLLHH